MAEECIQKLEDDINEMICDQDFDNYQGLDKNRDTEAEIETALRIFSNVVSRRKEIIWDEEGEEEWLTQKTEKEHFLYTVYHI